MATRFEEALAIAQEGATINYNRDGYLVPVLMALTPKYDNGLPYDGEWLLSGEGIAMFLLSKDELDMHSKEGRAKIKALLKTLQAEAYLVVAEANVKAISRETGETRSGECLTINGKTREQKTSVVAMAQIEEVAGEKVLFPWTDFEETESIGGLVFNW